MPFVILPTNSASGGYNVANSLRFNFASNDYLDRTLTTPTNNKIFTWSSWVKRSNITSDHMNIFRTAGSPSTGFRFELTSDIFRLFFDNASTGDFQTTQVFRDVSAWYHIVVAVDTTQATNTNRVKIYSNGSQITSFSTATYPTQNFVPQMNSAINHLIGVSFIGENYNGYMSEINFIDGQQLTPSSFGETDEDTGIWKPKAYTGTYGTNGFYLQFKNSASLGTDSSGNGNTFTVNNLTSIDQTTDTPTNNFATMNPLMIPSSNSPTFTEGNLSVVNTSASGNFGGASTIGASKGKWYWEGKITQQTTACGHIGIDGDPSATAYTNLYAGSNAWSYGYNANGTKYNNNTGTSYGNSFTLNDILMIAMDLDNNYVYFGINGTWQNSGVPTSGSSGTGSAFSISSSPPSGYYFIETGDGSGSNYATFQSNFGNPPYTANGYTDGAGYGNFSYAVPSGYYALNTKNLATFG